MAKLFINKIIHSRWFRISAILLGIILAIPLILYLVFRSPPVQTWAGRQVARYLSAKLDTRVSVTGVDVTWFLNTELEGLLILDQHHDTLLYTEGLHCFPGHVSLSSNEFDFRSIGLKNPYINLRKYPGDSSYNFQFLADYFSPPTQDTVHAAEKWLVRLREISISGGTLKVQDENTVKQDQGIDFNKLLISDLNLEIHGLRITGDTVSAIVKHLSFKESSGFNVKKLECTLMSLPSAILFRNLTAETGSSSVNLELAMEYDDPEDLRYFLDKVRLRAEIERSGLGFSDLAFFSPSLAGMDAKVIFSGQVSGTISNLKVKGLGLEYGATSRFRGDIRLNGLPEIAETFIQAEIRELSTNQYDLQSIRLPGGGYLKLPDEMVKAGKINVKGNFTGFYDDFVSYASFRTDLGQLSTDLSLSNDRNTNQIRYKGNLSARDFQLGLLISAEKQLGSLNMNVELEGSGTGFSSMVLKLDGVVDSVVFQGKRYQEIQLTGGLNERRFQGQFHIIDPDLDLKFEGEADLSTKTPAFDFTAKISHARLNKINLVHSDTAFEVSTLLVVNFQGIDPDSLTGTMVAEDLLVRKNGRPEHFRRISAGILALPAGTRNLFVTSDQMDFRMSGYFNFSQFVESVRSYAGLFLPELFNATASSAKFGNQAFTYECQFRDPAPFTRILLPDLNIMPETFLSGTYNPSKDIFSIKVKSPGVSYKGITTGGLSMEGSQQGGRLMINAGAERFSPFQNRLLEDLKLDASVGSDTLSFRLGWNNKEDRPANHADISGNAIATSGKGFRVLLNRSSLVINDSLWIINPGSLLEADSARISISSLNINSSSGNVDLNGTISSNPLEQLIIDIRKMRLSYLNELISNSNFQFSGLLNGQLRLNNLFNAPNIQSDLFVQQFCFNHDTIGNAVITTSWDPRLQALLAKADFIYTGKVGQSTPVRIHGSYLPRQKENNLDFTAELSNFRLKSISRLLSGFSSRMLGNVFGNLYLRGSVEKPELTGKINVMRGSIRIDYLNVDYSFKHEFDLGKDYISLDGLTVSDTFGNKGYISGRIWHDHFRNFRSDLSLKPEKVLCLNTDQSNNSLFYGKAYGSGLVKIHGPFNNLVIDMTATTEKGSKVFLPINMTADVSENNYIEFRTSEHDTAERLKPKTTVHSGLTMNFDLNATPDAGIRITLPYGMGNIDGFGEGRLNMKLSRDGEFNIYGDYKITQGKYGFRLQNLLTRDFTLLDGGKILFNGDIYDTKIDLRAAYKLDVPLSGLKVASTQSDIYNRKVPVNCIINLKGSLFNPDITFGIRMEERDQELERLIFSQIDTTSQEQLSEQIIFLLVLKQFKPIERNSMPDINNTVGSSSFELLSSQLNSWLSQISNNFDLGVNYKPGDKLTDDELTVALSTQLFSERVIIDGNFGMAGGTKSPAAGNQNTSNIVGDVNIDVKLTRDGRFRFKAFNRSNNFSVFENYAPFTQGIGLFYRRDFDRFGDLFRKK